MKVIALTAENIKRLKAVRIEPDGNVVVISGRNAQGKSSVLDSIWYALAGAAATKDTPKPVRDGEETGKVTLDLGDFTVTRTWTAETTTLAVMSKDGAKYPSPQKFLDEKLGALSFDPLGFSQLSAKDQLATLLALVELPFNLDLLAGERKGIYDARTEAGRDVRALQGQLEGLDEVPQDTPAEEVSADDLVEQQRLYQQAAQDYDAQRRRVEKAKDDAEAHRSRFEILERELERERETGVALFQALVDAEKNFAHIQIPDPVDVASAIAEIDATNQAVRLRQEHEKIGIKLVAAKLQVEDFSAQLEAIDQRKSDALAAAKMPIEGLAFDDDGVTYRGIPFKQCSSAEQLRVSLAMAMSLNPTIKVIRISDGSLLDSENMAVIAEMADEHDFQCWIERVDETGQVGFVIEDGEVVSHGADA